MYAITLREFGDPDVMTWTQVPDPVPGPGEVIVDVVATAVNRADLQQRIGVYPPPPGASEILGLECSGIVSQLGPAVTGVSVGDPVCALVSGGGYAERVAVPVGQLMPVPDGIDIATAAALPEVACTVWSNLVMTAGLRSGHTLLVHGGGSGIGTHATQVAREIGVRTAVTAGSPAKLEVCRTYGADILIDYRASDFVDELRRATDGHGADVILDNMGASYLSRNIGALAMDGHLVIIGFQGGISAEINLAALMSVRGTVHSAGLRGRPPTGHAGKAHIVREVIAHVWPMIESGRVVPVVHAQVPISEAARAHRLLDEHDTVGKVLLAVS